MGLRLAVLLVVAVCVASCSISDSDRCPAGYAFLEKEKVCWEVRDEDTETDEVPQPDAGDDTGSVDSGAQDPDLAADGFGKVCGNADDCDGAADYCLAMPGEDGTCSYTDCDSGRECPADNVCCNCTGFAYMGVVVCIPDSMTNPGGFIRSTCDCE